MQQAQQRHTPTRSQALGVKPIDAATWAVSSSKPCNPPYVVRKNEDGTYICDCPSYNYDKVLYGGVCKHVQAVTGALMSPPAPLRATRYCEECGVDIARGASCFCSEGCRRTAEIAAYKDAPDAVAYTEALLATTTRSILGLPPIDKVCSWCGSPHQDAASPYCSTSCHNADSVSRHRFAEGSQTLIVGSRPSPLESAGYGG